MKKFNRLYLFPIALFISFSAQAALPEVLPFEEEDLLGVLTGQVEQSFQQGLFEGYVPENLGDHDIVEEPLPEVDDVLAEMQRLERSNQVHQAAQLAAIPLAHNQQELVQHTVKNAPEVPKEPEFVREFECTDCQTFQILPSDISNAIFEEIKNAEIATCYKYLKQACWAFCVRCDFGYEIPIDCRLSLYQHMQQKPFICSDFVIDEKNPGGFLERELSGCLNRIVDFKPKDNPVWLNCSNPACRNWILCPEEICRKLKNGKRHPKMLALERNRHKVTCQNYHQFINTRNTPKPKEVLCKKLICSSQPLVNCTNRACLNGRHVVPAQHVEAVNNNLFWTCKDMIWDPANAKCKTNI